jgi:hypothetical protein
VVKVAFFILRFLVALGALVVLAGTLAVFLFSNLLGLLKNGVKVVAAVVTIFASGFQKSSTVPDPSVEISPLLMGIAITFVAIFASVFTPGQKIFLHIVAVMAFAAGAWDVWRSTNSPTHEILYLPVVVLWFVYYVVCLRRAA